MNEVKGQFVEAGEIVARGEHRNVADYPWNRHPSFSGVALKHLLTGQDTDGKFSCHVVRIEAGCKIGSHLHEGKWELHEVLSGQGFCRTGSKTIAYHPGVVAAIPADEVHEVQAEAELYLLAKFVPPLS